jgi:predicted chitinase
MTITAAQITSIASSLKGEKAIRIAAAFTRICPQYEINTADILHEFIANLMEECAEFSRFEENLSYSAERMVQVWPSRFLIRQLMAGFLEEVAQYKLLVGICTPCLLYGTIKSLMPI